MRRIILALMCAISLGGCFFGGGGGDLYAGYQRSLGIYVASSTVNTLCLTPALRNVISQFERQFGRPIVMTSGYRTPWHNASVGGADGSLHMQCKAADFFIPGIDKRRLIDFAMNNRNVGGLGCYPGRNFIHVDVRDRPRGYTRPVTFSGC